MSIYPWSSMVSVSWHNMLPYSSLSAIFHDQHDFFPGSIMRIKQRFPVKYVHSIDSPLVLWKQLYDHYFLKRIFFCEFGRYHLSLFLAKYLLFLNHQSSLFGSTYSKMAHLYSTKIALSSSSISKLWWKKKKKTFLNSLDFLTALLRHMYVDFWVEI